MNLSVMVLTPQAAAAWVVFSAILHAGWNASLHQFSAPARQATLVVLAACFTLSTVLACVLGQYGLWHLDTLGWTLVAGVAEGLYFYCLGITLERLPLGTGYLVMRGTSMLGVTALSWLFLGERLGWMKSMGMAAIAAGIVLRSAGTSSQKQAAHRSSGLYAALACAAGICGYHLAYGRALALGLPPLPLFAASLGIALAVNGVMLGRAWVASAFVACRGQGVRVAATSAVCLAAFALFLVCLDHLEAGTAICLRNLSVVFAQAMGWWFGERVTPGAVAAICAFVLGGCLLVYAP